MSEAVKIDELVWEFVAVAHKLHEAGTYRSYPELKLFIEYLITHYPALKEHNDNMSH